MPVSTRNSPSSSAAGLTMSLVNVARSFCDGMTESWAFILHWCLLAARTSPAVLEIKLCRNRPSRRTFSVLVCAEICGIWKKMQYTISDPLTCRNLICACSISLCYCKQYFSISLHRLRPSSLRSLSFSLGQVLSICKSRCSSHLQSSAFAEMSSRCTQNSYRCCFGNSTFQ